METNQELRGAIAGPSKFRRVCQLLLIRVLAASAILFALYFATAEEPFPPVREHTALSAIARYEQALRAGEGAAALCVYAGAAAATVANTKDEPNLRRWQDIHQRDCRQAGM